MPTLDANALTTVDNVKDQLNDLSVIETPFMEMHYDLASATAATVEIDEEQEELKIVITGGAEAGTTTVDLTDPANDTIGELVAVLDADASLTGLYVRALAPADTASISLLPRDTVSMFTETNTVTLIGVNDNRIIRAINSTSAKIETLTRRKFKERTYRHWFDHVHGDTLSLESFPITELVRIGIGLRMAFRAEYSGADVRASIAVVLVSGVVTVRLRNGTATTDISSADQATITLIVAAINAIADWEAVIDDTDLGGFASADLRIQPPRDTKDRFADLHEPDERTVEYDLIESSGLLDLRFAVTGKSVIFVEYSAGFAVIPADLEQIATELATEAIYEIGRDNTLIEEELDEYRYERAVETVLNREENLKTRLANWINYGPAEGLDG